MILHSLNYFVAGTTPHNGRYKLYFHHDMHALILPDVRVSNYITLALNQFVES